MEQAKVMAQICYGDGQLRFLAPKRRTYKEIARRANSNSGSSERGTERKKEREILNRRISLCVCDAWKNNGLFWAI